MKLNIDHLSKEYGNRKVLDIDRLELQEGAITAIIGPNGAGKTTLLNIIGKLDTQTGGEITYSRGTDTLEDFKREVTLVFQNPYLIRTTVEKNITYPLKLRGWSKGAMEERATSLMKDLGLEKLRHEKAWKLSGGETQKVALARALSFRPKLLLLDEPTANIDPSTSAEIERMLLKINKEEGTTIIIVTHNLPQAKRVCNQLVLLNQGRLVEAGDCMDILSTLSNPMTRRFVEGEILI